MFFKFLNIFLQKSYLLPKNILQQQQQQQQQQIEI